MLANQRHDTRGLAGRTLTTPHLRCLASPLTVFSRGPFSLVACSCNQFTDRLTSEGTCTCYYCRGTDPLDLQLHRRDSSISLSARLVCKSGRLGSLVPPNSPPTTNTHACGSCARQRRRRASLTSLTSRKAAQRDHVPLPIPTRESPRWPGCAVLGLAPRQPGPRPEALRRGHKVARDFSLPLPEALR